MWQVTIFRGWLADTLMSQRTTVSRTWERWRDATTTHWSALVHVRGGATWRVIKTWEGFLKSRTHQIASPSACCVNNVAGNVQFELSDLQSDVGWANRVKLLLTFQSSAPQKELLTFFSQDWTCERYSLAQACQQRCGRTATPVTLEWFLVHQPSFANCCWSIVTKRPLKEAKMRQACGIFFKRNARQSGVRGQNWETG